VRLRSIEKLLTPEVKQPRATLMEINPRISESFILNFLKMDKQTPLDKRKFIVMSEFGYFGEKDTLIERK